MHLVTRDCALDISVQLIGLLLIVDTGEVLRLLHLHKFILEFDPIVLFRSLNPIIDDSRKTVCVVVS